MTGAAEGARQRPSEGRVEGSEGDGSGQADGRRGCEDVRAVMMRMRGEEAE